MYPKNRSRISIRNACILVVFMAVMTGVFRLAGGNAFIYAAAGQARVVFSDYGISEAEAYCSAGYRIDGTTFTIQESGIYEVSGSCRDGSIIVSKNVSDVTLILDGISLRSTTTAPLVIKSSSQVRVHLNGTSELYDDEDPAAEETDSGFEGAAIKAKNGSTLIFCGDGTLNIFGNAKNGIKGGSKNSITFNGGTYNVRAAGNGIASDGSLIFNDGSYSVNAENDGIKSVPEAADANSAGMVTFNGGTYEITVNGDGIQADSALIINNGDFDITTHGGYNAPGFDGDTMSCKGLKASGDRETITNTIEISGGTFTLNTADDAIHSGSDVKILGGTFMIRTQDDGIHADTALTLGEAGSANIRDPEITIMESYEGLESGSVTVFNGKYYIKACDDAVNAADGSSSGSDPGLGGWDFFRPGWGSGTGDYSITICGGEIYADCNGDGLDSNGSITITGGDLTVFSMQANGDNSPIDADDAISVTGGTILAAGSAGVDVISPSAFSGINYFLDTQAVFAAGSTLAVYDNGMIVRTDQLPRNVSFVMYASSSLAGTPSVAIGPLDVCSSNPFRHNWKTDDGLTYTCASCGAEEHKGSAATVSVPLCIHTLEEINCRHTHVRGDPEWTWDEEKYDAARAVFICDDCGESVAYDAEIRGSLSNHMITFTAVAAVNGSEYTDERTASPFVVSFETGDHATVDVYYTQDYTKADETAAAGAVARDGKTGYPVISGDGQVNFKVIPEKGYAVSDVKAEAGTYKNIKTPDETGTAGLYRLTKVTASTNVVITVTECVHEETEKPEEQSTEERDPAVSGTGTHVPGDAGSTVSVDTAAQTKVPAAAAGNRTAGSGGIFVPAEPAAAKPTVAKPTVTKPAAAKPDRTVTDGMSAAKVHSVITGQAGDGDAAGSTFYLLRLSGSPQKNSSVKLKWKKVKGASKYVIYGNKCGKKNRMKKIAETKKTSRVIRKLKKNTYYKYLVVALKKNKVLAISRMTHVATGGGSKGNPVSVQADRKRIKVKVRKTKKISAKVKTGTLKVSRHRRVAFESSDPEVARVDQKGKVTGVSRGSCTIYVYAQNGKYAKVKVDVS